MDSFLWEFELALLEADVAQPVAEKIITELKVLSTDGLEAKVTYPLRDQHIYYRDNELIIPIDSEPSAIYQALLGEDKLRIREILLTASGGPFFSKGASWSELARVSPADALNHPRWNMGKKVSIDSATLVNKGLELIEISRMFDIDPDRIRVMLHPQSIIHSGVVFVDGSTKFQASPPNMKYPISYALHHPARNMNDLPGIHYPLKLTMDDMPESVSRPITLARKALKIGPAGQIAYASADEWAVSAFLTGDLPFHLIPEVIAKNINF